LVLGSEEVIIVRGLLVIGASVLTYWIFFPLYCLLLVFCTSSFPCSFFLSHSHLYISSVFPAMAMASSLTLSLILGILVLGLFVVKILPIIGRGKRPFLPPGPKPKFLIGNLTDLPKSGEREWQHWLKHKTLYGSFNYNKPHRR
jgi:hypothetical protein